MSGTTTERREGIAALAELVSRMTNIREATPGDTGAALVAQLSQRLAAVEQRVQAQEARR
jgi:hypothetical protein